MQEFIQTKTEHLLISAPFLFDDLFRNYPISLSGVIGRSRTRLPVAL